MSLNASQLQHPADLGSEASFGQENNASKEIGFDGVTIILHALKHKQDFYF